MQLGMNSNKSADVLTGSYRLVALNRLYWLGGKAGASAGAPGFYFFEKRPAPIRLGCRYNFVFVTGTIKGTFLVITLDKTSHIVFIHIDGAVVCFVLFIIFIVCTKITTGHTKVPLLL